MLIHPVLQEQLLIHDLLQSVASGVKVLFNSW